MFDVYEDAATKVTDTVNIPCGVNRGRPDHCVAYADYRVRGSCKHEHAASDWVSICSSHKAMIDLMVCSLCLRAVGREHTCKIIWETKELT